LYAHPDTLIFKKDFSLGVLWEISSYAQDVYDVIDTISKLTADQFQPSIIADHEGNKLVILRCFEYYNSPSLDSMIKTMDKRIEGW